MMRKIFCVLGAGFLLGNFSVLSGQGVGAEVAGLREDVRLLVQQVGQLTMRVEALERENEELRKKAAGANFATVAQLNEAVADLNKAVKSGDAAVTEKVAAQLKKLADATNVSMESLAKSINQRAASAVPAVPREFSTNFPSEGIEYVVERGDTVAVIAKKTGARMTDIINANRIADPTKLQVGQKLFIPGGK